VTILLIIGKALLSAVLVPLIILPFQWGMRRLATRRDEKRERILACRACAADRQRLPSEMPHTCGRQD
jgi:hypothetical protein